MVRCSKISPNAMLSDTVEFQSEKIQLLNNECGTQRQACRAFENACEMNNEVINVLLKRVSDLEDFVLHQNLKTN